MAARHYVVLPMPGSPSITKPETRSAADAKKSAMLSDSGSPGTTPAAAESAVNSAAASKGFVAPRRARALLSDGPPPANTNVAAANTQQIPR